MEKTNNNSKGIKEHSLATLSLAALGIVFGDIGTSPLYAIRECFHGEYAIATSQDNIFGVLSLMFWSLTIIVSIKYLIFIFKADNKGEGGVVALTALIQRIGGTPTRRRLMLISLGIFAGCLLYGDGMITPAISVLSAVEGLRVITPQFQQYIIPMTMVILAALFILQQRGTTKIGFLFGPVMLVWFFCLAILGLVQIFQHPAILKAFLPNYAIDFILNSGFHGFTVLGAVFLVVTGAEALYADLGHFGAKPIRYVWFFFVLPTLVINYFGQGALLISSPEQSHHPFYAMVPGWAVIPMVVLATCATIIASQAVITGVFSLTRQAIQMGYLPRLEILHTSLKQIGQIYVPQVNWLVMVATLGLVLGFQSSSKLAAAYGVAVSSTMLISTLLFYVVARKKWGWNILYAGLPVLIFFITDITFLSANATKILHGAWFPLALGGLIMLVMTTWKRGRQILGMELQSLSVPFEKFKSEHAIETVERIKGDAVFLSGRSHNVPMALTHNLEHNKILHTRIILVNFKFLEIPRVPNSEKLEVEDWGGGFHQVVASYGFMETPSIRHVMELLAGQGLKVEIEEASYFLGREKLIIDERGAMSRWRARLFIFLSKNALDASTYFDIPEDRAIEVGVQLPI